MSKIKVKVNEINISLDNPIKEILEKTGRDCSELIRGKSPKGTGEYAAGWTYEMSKDNKTVTVFNNGENKTLTHLLELGHRTKLGTGKGRKKAGGKSTVAPNEHIRPAYNIIKEQYMENSKNIKPNK